MSDKIDFNQNGYLSKINDALKKYIPELDLHGCDITDSVSYSLLNAGKRLRPILTMEFCKASLGDVNLALPFACAVEMIHTYSLIHDDLPCMDNDNLRRGKPSNHIVFGESTALLAGDTLLNLAFETMLGSELSLNIKTQDRALKCAREMAKASGLHGMIGGQAIDLEFENSSIPLEIICDMYRKKTGAIIIAACKMGCICAGADEEMIKASEDYASSLGLAFQIVDDILDLTSDDKTLGKPVKSDLKSDKSTYVSLVGIEKSKKAVKDLTDKAIASLDTFDGDTQFLKNLAVYLQKRKN